MSTPKTPDEEGGKKIKEQIKSFPQFKGHIKKENPIDDIKTLDPSKKPDPLKSEPNVKQEYTKKP